MFLYLCESRSEEVRGDRADDGASVQLTSLTKSDADLTKTSLIPASPTHISVSKLDHMRNSAKYLKNLRTWADELSVRGKVIDRGRGAVFVVLVGSGDDIRSYLRRWRTERMDIDSKGRPCKERLMEVLYQGQLNTSSSVSQPDCKW